MKVKIIQRSVYHKYAEWLLNNEELYVDKIDEAISEANFEYGTGIDDYRGMNFPEAESEWRFEYGDRYGGHL